MLFWMVVRFNQFGGRFAVDVVVFMWSYGKCWKGGVFFFFTGKVLANGLMKGIGLMSLVMRRRVVHWDFVMDLNLVLITEHFGLEDFA